MCVCVYWEVPTCENVVQWLNEHMLNLLFVFSQSSRKMVFLILVTIVTSSVTTKAKPGVVTNLRLCVSVSKLDRSFSYSIPSHFLTCSVNLNFVFGVIQPADTHMIKSQTHQAAVLQGTPDPAWQLSTEASAAEIHTGSVPCVCPCVFVTCF